MLANDIKLASTVRTLRQVDGDKWSIDEEGKEATTGIQRMELQNWNADGTVDVEGEQGVSRRLFSKIS